LTNLIGSEYKFEKNYKPYQDVAELFNSAMQSHLAASE
jgi:hypothetical protein